MQEFKCRLARVHWQRIAYNTDAIAQLKTSADYGVYQIYADHPLYGRSVLGYVGSAIDQTFAQRLKQDAKWLAEEQNVAIHVGRIDADDYRFESDWDVLIRNVESLTIYYHAPAYNSSRISAYEGPNILVQNWEERGSLLPEYSSNWPEAKPPRPSLTV